MEFMLYAFCWLIIMPLLCYGFYKQGRLDATKDILEDLNSQLGDTEKYVTVLRNSGVNDVEVVTKIKEDNHE